MFVYVNTLYYTLSLLVAVMLLLATLVINSMMQTLTMLMFIIVYVGAIMILIGYICAISPNLIVASSLPSVYYYFPFFFAVMLSLFWEEKSWVIAYNRGDQMSNYFYSRFGFLSFMFIVLILFITLLIVTSQYLAPKGPFRSISL